MSKQDWFRGDVLYGIEDNVNAVDRKNEVINNLAVISLGLVKGHKWYHEGKEIDMYIDNVTLHQVANLGNDSKLGIKSRYGHPNMSSEALGTGLGRVKTFVVDEEAGKTKATLHLDPSAHKSPNGDLSEYIMSVAESDPDSFGVSIAFQNRPIVKKVKKGDLAFSEPEEGDETEFVAFARAEKLFAVDAVDEPAANEGLFGHNFYSDSVIPSHVMTQFFEKFLADEKAVAKTLSFLERYKQFSALQDDTEEPNDDVYGVEGEALFDVLNDNEYGAVKTNLDEIEEDSFKREKRRSKSFKKSYDVVTGKLKSNGKRIECLYRYDADEWSAEEAEKHSTKKKAFAFEQLALEKGNEEEMNVTDNSEAMQDNKEVGKMVEEKTTVGTEELEAKNVELAKELTEKERALDEAQAKLASVEKERRALSIASFIAEQKNAGSVLPRFEEKLSVVLTKAAEASDEMLAEVKGLVKSFGSLVELDTEIAEGGSDSDDVAEEDAELQAASKLAEEKGISVSKALSEIRDKRI